jgi:hypothetical protein
VNAQLTLDLTEGDKGAYVVKDRTIVFKAETTQAEWEDVTRQLADLFAHTATAHVRTGFLLGDALNFGELHFSEEAANAIDATRKQMQLTVKTIENYAWIAGKVPPENRHELLSFAHHESVARLDSTQQRELLDEAEREALPVSKLKARVREIAPSRPRTIKPKKKRKGEAVATLEKAIEAAAILAEFVAPYIAKKPSEITVPIRRGFDEYARPIFNFCRRFVRKS